MLCCQSIKMLQYFSEKRGGGSKPIITVRIFCVNSTLGRDSSESNFLRYFLWIFLLKQNNYDTISESFFQQCINGSLDAFCPGTNVHLFRQDRCACGGPMDGDQKPAKPCNRMQNTLLISGSSKHNGKGGDEEWDQACNKTKIREESVKRMQDGSK